MQVYQQFVLEQSLFWNQVISLFAAFNLDCQFLTGVLPLLQDVQGIHSRTKSSSAMGRIQESPFLYFGAFIDGWCVSDKSIKWQLIVVKYLTLVDTQTTWDRVDVVYLFGQNLTPLAWNLISRSRDRLRKIISVEKMSQASGVVDGRLQMDKNQKITIQWCIFWNSRLSLLANKCGCCDSGSCMNCNIFKASLYICKSKTNDFVNKHYQTILWS